MESMVKELIEFYKGKNVLITGHSGFKGSWITYILHMFESNVTGVSLEPPTEPNLFSLLNIRDKVKSKIIDIRNLNDMKQVFYESKPEIVIHLAAQPLVIKSYENPVDTYTSNVVGTVNICECVRLCKSVKSFVNVTTDKVYENKEWEYGYREIDSLNGYDPYSNSKSCSELVTSCYSNSFFKELEIAVSTCRAGNVIGGGDFSENRILPDCIKSVIKNEKIIVRNPNSQRPYQHVLEAVMFYLFLAMIQYKNRQYESRYNIGPNEDDCITTGELVDIFCDCWGNGSEWISLNSDVCFHEANMLKLDTSKIRSTFNWKPVWNVEEAIQKTVEWTKAYLKNCDIEKMTSMQIEEFLNKFLGGSNK